MIFMCESKDLKKALTQIKPAVPKMSSLPALQRVKMVTSKNGVTIRGTNLEIAIQVKMLCHVDERGIGYAELKPVLDALPKKNEKVLVSYDKDGLVVNTKTDGFTDEFVIKDMSKQFPDFPNVALTTDIELDGAVEKILPFVSTEETRHFLNGFYLRGNAHLRLVATDGRRLIEVCRKWPADVEVGFIIPTAAAKVLAKMEDPIRMGWLSEPVYQGGGEEKKETLTTAMFKSNGLTLATRFLQGEYPDYESILKPAYECSDVQVFINREELLKSMKEIGDAIKPKPGVQFSFQHRSVTMTGKKNGLTVNREMVVVQDVEDEWSIVFNHKYLVDTLKSMECEEIALRTKMDGLSPVAFLGDDDIQSIMMPLKVK